MTTLEKITEEYGETHPHRPVLFCGKPLADATREELLAMITLLCKQSADYAQQVVTANVKFFQLARDQGPPRKSFLQCFFGWWR